LKTPSILGNEARARVGLFGGTFDPVHKGHIEAAQKVMRRFSLSKVYFIPSSVPPHKDYRTYASAQDRLAMIRLALVGRPEFEVSDVELQRQGPSYTLDTVKVFSDHITVGAELFFLLGTDAFFEIDTWYKFEEIFNLIPLVVMVRPEGVPKGYTQMVETVKSFLAQAVSPNYHFDGQKGCFIHNQLKSVFVYEVTTENISSTHIRRSIKTKMPIDALVPPAVEDYIIKRGLYQ
jgi:nicotinate-nucleotide adenylyltransferase